MDQQSGSLGCRDGGEEICTKTDLSIQKIRMPKPGVGYSRGCCEASKTEI